MHVFQCLKQSSSRCSSNMNNRLCEIQSLNLQKPKTFICLCNRWRRRREKARGSELQRKSGSKHRTINQKHDSTKSMMKRSSLVGMMASIIRMTSPRNNFIARRRIQVPLCRESQHRQPDKSSSTKTPGG